MDLLTIFSDDTGYTIDRIGVAHGGGADGGHPAAEPGQLVARQGIVEVYPAGALAMWQLPYKGYKPRSKATAAPAAKQRGALLATLLERTSGWLIVPVEVRPPLVETDHALDALICALVAYAAAAGKTYLPDIEQRGAARREGWIHLPLGGSLDGLALSTA